MKRPPSLPTGRQLAAGLVTACVASAVLAFPAHAAGSNSVAAVQPVINIANAAGGLVVSGTAADDVEQVNVQVVDQDLGSFEAFKSLPAPADGITQDWSLKLSEVEVGDCGVTVAPNDKIDASAIIANGLHRFFADNIL